MSKRLIKADADAAVRKTIGRLEALARYTPGKIPADKLAKVLISHVRSIGQDELGNKLDEILLDAELVGCPAELPAA